MKVIECLDDYCGGGHRKHSSEKKTVYVGEPEETSDGESAAHHADDNDERRDYGRSAGIEKFLETEFQSEREKKHDDSHLCPELDVFLRRDRGQISEIRAGEEAGHNVAEDDRLFYPLEKNRGDSGEDKQESQVGYEAFNLKFWA